MAIFSTDQVLDKIEKKQHELGTVKQSIELDHEELAMRDDIRKNSDQMLAEYSAREKELEDTLAHEQKLLGSLDMLKKPFEDMKAELAQGKSDFTKDERATQEKNARAHEEAEARLRQFDLTHTERLSDEEKEERSGLYEAVKLRNQAFSASEEALKEAEQRFDESQKPVYDNIAAVKSNLDRHEKAVRDAQIELEDIALKRSYVTDCITDNTGDDELHDVIRRKEDKAAAIEKDIEKLQKQQHAHESLIRFLWACLIVFAAFLIFGLMHVLGR